MRHRETTGGEVEERTASTAAGIGTAVRTSSASSMRGRSGVCR
ncbi:MULTISPECIES: hypothetical protein [Amycolatopsis]|nr:hypothetical protein [Amycolatopsis bullii]